MPPAIDKMPVQRRRNGILLYPVPAFRMPPDEIAIPARLHELEVLGIGDPGHSQPVAVQPDLMTAEFIVETEAIAFIADLIQARRHRHETGTLIRGGSLTRHEAGA